MIIFDAHLDLAWNAIDWNRNLLLPVSEIRKQEERLGLSGKGRGANTVSITALREAEVAVCIATLLARVLRAGTVLGFDRYSSMEAAYAAAGGQLAYYSALESCGILRWIRNRRDLEGHINDWLDNPDGDERPGFILSMEGADPILAPDDVEEWWNKGLRIIGPAHYGVSPYAHGTGTEGGLFPAGKVLLKEMERVGMILDVTHLSDESFDEALEVYGGPVLASHHNCRALVPRQRQLTDDQIKRLIARDAVIGMALDAWMLHPGWIHGQTNSQQAGVQLESVIDHMDRICQLAGTIRHVGIGTDLDGGFGREEAPTDLDTIADLQKIPHLLEKRGYDAEAIRGIMYANWLEFFRKAWREKPA